MMIRYRTNDRANPMDGFADREVMNQDSSPGSPTLTRRAFMAVTGHYGVSVAIVLAGSGIPIGATVMQAAAQVAASEQEKRAAAEQVMIMAVDGLLDRYPNGPVTKETIYTSGSGLFKAQVEERSKGKIYVDLKLGGVLGVQAVDKIQQGIIQAGTVTTQNCASLVPVWNVMDLAYVIGNAKNMAKIMYSKEINQTLRKKSEESGLINLGGTPFFRWLNLGRSVKQDVKRPADVKGLKLRVTNSRLELAGLEILGANPTPISGGEISTAMEQGVVDGFNIGPHFALDFNLIESVRYVVNTKFMPNTDCIFVGTRWMRALPPALQEAIMEAAFERQKYLMDFSEPVYRDQVGVSADSPPDSAFKKQGIKVHLLSDEERSVWTDAMSFERNPVLNELADRFGREELELVRAVVAEEGEPEPTRWWA